MLKNRNTSLVDKAINYAVLHHKDVFRKGKNIPYIVHPLEAMSIVATITEDEELLASACLHDLLEDTDVSYEDLLNEFGKRIADIVKNESNNYLPNYENMSWKEIKLAALNELKKAPIDTKIVALGDKLSNMRAINSDYRKDKNNFFDRFNEKNPSLHKWRYYELLNCFNGLEDTDAYKEFKELVLDTFKDIE